jgi:YfiH family protein
MGVMGTVLERAGRKLLAAPALSAAGGNAHGFGLRGLHAAEDLCMVLGAGRWRAVALKQVHGDAVLAVDATAPDRAEGGGYDAAVTTQPGVLLTIRTADCVPLLLYDPVAGAVGAAHAGWRGSLANIAGKTVAALTRVGGSRPRDLVAAIGPSARACCYEVDAVVLEPLRAARSDWARHLRPPAAGRSSERARLDLAGLNALQLHEAGLDPGRISVLDGCTICRPNEFSSYRREGMRMRNMVSGIGLLPGEHA